MRFFGKFPFVKLLLYLYHCIDESCSNNKSFFEYLCEKK